MSSYVAPKDPDSVEIFGWDFGPMLPEGASIASVVGTELEDSTDEEIEFLSVPSISGTKVSQKLGGGTIDGDYGVRCRVTTTTGETLDLTLRFVVAQN
jgi:hypothetical protein